MLAPRQHEVRRRRREGEGRVGRGERLLALAIRGSRHGAARVEHRTLPPDHDLEPLGRRRVPRRGVGAQRKLPPPLRGRQTVQRGEGGEPGDAGEQGGARGAGAVGKRVQRRAIYRRHRRRVAWRARRRSLRQFQDCWQDEQRAGGTDARGVPPRGAIDRAGLRVRPRAREGEQQHPGDGRPPHCGAPRTGRPSSYVITATRANSRARDSLRFCDRPANLYPALFPIKRPGGPVSTETLQHVALFEKCRTFLPKAREVQAAGLHAWYKPISRSEDTVVVIEGKERIMMGSNNYLGLTHHPDVLAAAKSALDRYGSGCTGSRLLNGTLDLHVQLEAELAEFFGKEACVVFSTGYQANLGVVSGLVGRGDLVFLDKLDHASIVDGAKLAFGETQRFAHGDLAELERRLQKAPATVGKMIIVDGVYSMEGDIADVPALLKISQRYGAVPAVDDAHAVGVLGPKGDGTAAHFGLADEVDLIVGTFSKSLASIGGFLVGPEAVINYLRYNARPLVFTAALPPSNTAGGLSAACHQERGAQRRGRGLGSAPARHQ